MAFESKIKTIEWVDTYSRMVDQTVIPYEYKFVNITDGQEMFDAIRNMIVRGAPAIGIAGAHGVVLFAQELAKEDLSREDFVSKLIEKAEYMKTSRPTAVNLMWACQKQIDVINASTSDIAGIVEELKKNAIKLENEDIEINKKIGDYGAEVVPKGATILTHCNAGALATVGYGTALGVVRSAFAKDNTVQVFADETRPRQQGARITTFELAMDGIPVTLITDGMCSYFMSKGMIDMVVVGADRIAANGDTANKIGTYTVAIAAKYHNVPFYIAAPLSTIDTSIATGAEIPIEERSHEEVTHINGDWVCSDKVNVINPGFDVTPHELIAGIITEKGILRPDYNKSIAEAFNTSKS
ncbi:MAG: S-methyl-5-thioribose-1-phosphate isomerase [Candidatus Gastranaerophilales bacterium]|nr:S-methyl-5-thioribose-1-phosphate isomerase [Candidatus Gastranaerophilales bacterium]MCM1073606.1 S-methyl-5-thioribose-1-phosphate isomerase [Bacteroides sp.]